MSFGLVHVAGEIAKLENGAAWAKMIFVSVWLGFAASLFWINRSHGRHTWQDVPNLNGNKAFILFLSGVIGALALVRARTDVQAAFYRRSLAAESIFARSLC